MTFLHTEGLSAVYVAFRRQGTESETPSASNRTIHNEREFNMKICFQKKYLECIHFSVKIMCYVFLCAQVTSLYFFFLLLLGEILFSMKSACQVILTAR